MILWRPAAVLLLVVLAATSYGQRRFARITVAVAANAAPAMEELAKAYQELTSPSTYISIAPGSTGLLMRQLREGAPYDMFVSADMQSVQQLAREGFITSATVAPYARGRLVLWQNRESKPRLKQLGDLAGAGKFARVAIANPESAPYGAAAVAAIKAAGLYESVKDRLVFAESVAQAFQFCQSGNTDFAFVAPGLLTDQPPGLEVPDKLYPPLVQGLGVCTGQLDEEETLRFREFLLGPQGRDVFRRHGYLPPR